MKVILYYQNLLKKQYLRTKKLGYTTSFFSFSLLLIKIIGHKIFKLYKDKRILCGSLFTGIYLIYIVHN